MRIGAPVSGFRNAREWVALHVERALGAAYWPLPVEASTDEVAEYVSAAKQADLVIAEVGVWNNTIDSDPRKRDENIAYAIARLRTAEQVGARCCVNVAGSRGSVWYGPHPDNLTEETFDMVVKATQQIIDAVGPTHTTFTLECSPWMYPYDIASLAMLADAVDREAFAVHVDMVNLVNAFSKVYETGELTRDFFREFGNLVRSVHLKDFRIAENLVSMHIDEVPPGQGIFDLDALLLECDRLYDIPVMLEHLDSDAAYRKATEHVKKRAVVLGIKPSASRPYA